MKEFLAHFIVKSPGRVDDHGREIVEAPGITSEMVHLREKALSEVYTKKRGVQAKVFFISFSELHTEAPAKVDSGLVYRVLRRKVFGDKSEILEVAFESPFRDDAEKEYKTLVEESGFLSDFQLVAILAQHDSPMMLSI
jgi:hypothetical protein